MKILICFWNLEDESNFQRPLFDLRPCPLQTALKMSWSCLQSAIAPRAWSSWKLRHVSPGRSYRSSTVASRTWVAHPPYNSWLWTSLCSAVTGRHFCSVFIIVQLLFCSQQGKSYVESFATFAWCCSAHLCLPEYWNLCTFSVWNYWVIHQTSSTGLLSNSRPAVPKAGVRIPLWVINHQLWSLKKIYVCYIQF